MEIWPRRSHVLYPLIEAASGHKGRNTLWNEALESSFKELNNIFSTETLLSYPDYKPPFTVYTYASDKQLDAIIIENNKPIALLSIILVKTQHKYTTTEKVKSCWP